MRSIISMRSIIAAAAATALLAGGALAQDAVPVPTEAPVAVPVKAADGSDRGTVTLTQTAHGLLISAALAGLPDGPHGYHLHETGKCEGDFTSAGGHFNPTGKAHGFHTADGAHAGDMGNFTAHGGTAAFDMINPAVSLAGGEGALNDADGASLVIHASADDYTSQPAGASGERIACAVIFAAP